MKYKENRTNLVLTEWLITDECECYACLEPWTIVNCVPLCVFHSFFPLESLRPIRDLVNQTY